jgi:hypothetical protein
LEEDLFRPEYRADAIYRYSTMPQDVQVVIPEFVLYEERLHRSHGTQEPSCVSNSIHWQVTDEVCPFVMLSDLISRRREKSKKNLPVRIYAAVFLHDRSSLFEFAQRSCMEPHIFRVRVHVPLQISHSDTLSAQHSPHLSEELSSDDYAELEDIEEEVVQINNSQLTIHN